MDSELNVTFLFEGLAFAGFETDVAADFETESTAGFETE